MRLAAFLLIAACATAGCGGQEPPPKPPGPPPPGLQEALDNFEQVVQGAAAQARNPHPPERADFKIPPSSHHAEDLWDDVVDPIIANGTEEPALNPSQHVVYALFLIAYDIDNGGFEQLYFNTAGQYAGEGPKLLSTIGAERYAQLMTQANQLFRTGVPRDRSTRQALLHLIDSRRFAAFDGAWPGMDELAAFVETYIRAHPADFFSGA